MKSSSSLIAFALGASMLAFAAAEWTPKDATGDIRGYYSTVTPLQTKLCLNTEDVTAATFPHIVTTYSDVLLVKDDGSTVEDLKPADGAITLNSGEETNYYYFTANAELGDKSSNSYAVLDVVQAISKKEMTLQKQTVSLSGTNTEICFTDFTGSDGATCPNKKTVAAGTYKFSVVVQAKGSSFAIPTGATHFRFVTTVSAENFGTNGEIYFNNNPTVKTPPAALTHLNIYDKEADETMTYSFQQKFNYMNKQILNAKISAKAIDGQTPAMNVFYDFPIPEGFKADEWIAYDPEVAPVAGKVVPSTTPTISPSASASKAAASPSAAASGASASAVAAAALAAVAGSLFASL